MKKLRGLLVVVSLFGLVSCGNDPVEVPPTPGPVDKTFTKADFGVLYGIFYGTSGILNISEKGTTLSSFNYEETFFTLTATDIKDEQITSKVNDKDVKKTRKVVYFGASKNSEDSRLYLSLDDKSTLVYETLDAGVYKKEASFMPSIEEFTGCYNSMNEWNEYNIGISLGNYYFEDFDSFKVMHGLKTNIYLMNYYSKSYYVQKGNTFTKYLDIYDYVDDYLFYSVTLDNSDPASTYLKGDDNGSLYADPTFLQGDYYADDGKISLALNVEEKKLTFNGLETNSFEMKFDEKGSYAETTLGGKTVKLRANSVGLTYEEGNEVKLYVADTQTSLLGIYKNNDLTFEYYLDDESNYKLKINDVDTSFSLSVIDDQLAIKTNYNSKDYTFSSYKPSVAIKIYTDNSMNYLLNEETFMDVFARSLISRVDSVSKDLVMNDQHKVTFNTKTSDWSFDFKSTDEYPSVKFTSDGSNYTLKLVDVSFLIFSLTKDGTSDVSYYFDKAVVLDTYGTFTKNSKKDITVDAKKINYFGKDYNYSILPYYNPGSFSYLVSYQIEVDGKKLDLISQSSEQLVEFEKGKDGLLYITSSYISYSVYETMIGTYTYDGLYGDESFYLESNGKFYADKLNATNTGLEKVEFQYQLSFRAVGTTNTPCIEFEYSNDTIVYLYKTASSLLAVNTKYVADYIYKYNGSYFNSDLSHSLYLDEDLVYVDGEAVTIDTYTKSGDTTVLKGGSYTITFSTEAKKNKVKINNGTENIELSEETVDLSKFVGDYSIESEGVTTSFSFSNEVIDVLTKVKRYRFVVDGTQYVPIVTTKDGKLAVKTSVGFDTYYLTKQADETIVASKEGGLVPPPPPPPPAPSL